jgi:hypothetical protein
MELSRRLKDKRVKKIVVLDVETLGTGEKEPPIIFDLGYIITDKLGNEYIKKSYLIKEIFLNMDLMKRAYYYSKYPEYLEGLSKGEFELKTWEEIIIELYELIHTYNISQVSAYNLGFDLRALEYTNQYIRGNEFGIFEGLELQDIWDMAVDVLGQQKTYQKQFHKMRKFTPSGLYLQSRAESVWQYCMQDFNFIEAHTGLKDCEIEVKIMARCYRNHKKYTKGYNNNPFTRMKVNPNYLKEEVKGKF